MSFAASSFLEVVLSLTLAASGAASGTSGTGSANAASAASSGISEALLTSHIDTAVLVLVVCLGVWGLFTGAVRQLSKLGAAIVGIIGMGQLSPVLAPVLAQNLPPTLPFPFFFLSAASSFLAFFLIYIAAYIVLRLVLKRLVPNGEDGFLNRTGGLALGALKALLIAYVILSGMALLESPLRNMWARFPEEEAVSRAYAAAKSHNLFRSIGNVISLQTALSANLPARDPRTMAAQDEVQRSPGLLALASDPRVKELASERDVREALLDGNYAALLSNPKVRALLSDETLFGGAVNAGALSALSGGGDGSGSEGDE